jgi:3-oxoacyl-[acyl-carrier protein] reductase
MIDRKVALVTGGSRGIGRGIAVELGRLGFAVLINYRDNLSAAAETRQIVEDAGGTADICAADISVRSHRDLLLDYLMENFGRIDLLVNNAGVAPLERKDLLEADEKSFDRVMNVNLKGPYFLTQQVARLMIGLKKQNVIESPAIVTIGSISAYTASISRGEYCVSKAALGMMTALFACRLAAEGINVYEVRPGVVQTDMTAAVRQLYDRRIAEGLTPIRRWGQPEDVARIVGAIATGALPFSTGEVINVDGGWHLRQL